MGLKFFRDGLDSVSLVAMNGVDGQKSWNIFEMDWFNHIPYPKNPETIPLVQKFSDAT